MRKMTDVVKSDLLIVEDTEITGIVDGFVRVENARLELRGLITGNLTMHVGSVVELRGKVNGNVTNEGGTLRATGMIDGTLTRAADNATVDPGARGGHPREDRLSPWLHVSGLRRLATGV